MSILGELGIGELGQTEIKASLRSPFVRGSGATGINASRELDDRFLFSVASWMPKTMGTAAMNVQVAFVGFDAGWSGAAAG